MKKWFKGINTLEELKAEYKRLAMANHPDRGGNLEAMQEINNEYDMLSKILPSKDKEATSEQNQANAEMFRSILNNIIHLEGLEIEICGTWLWVSGNTKEHKDILKANGFKWAKKKENMSLWFWRAEEYKTRSKGSTMDSIRDKYGSERINPTFRPSLV